MHWFNDVENLILKALHKSVFRDVLNEYYDNNWSTHKTNTTVTLFCTKAYAVSWPNCQLPPSRVWRHLLFKANTTCKKNRSFFELEKGHQRIVDIYSCFHPNWPLSRELYLLQPPSHMHHISHYLVGISPTNHI